MDRVSIDEMEYDLGQKELEEFEDAQFGRPNSRSNSRSLQDWKDEIEYSKNEWRLGE